jgi:Pyridoxamine 5'-phosphate oxidase
MYAMIVALFTTHMNNKHQYNTPLTQGLIFRLLAKRSFCTLATAKTVSASIAPQPHVAGVVYAFVDGVLYISTKRTSRKARNLSDNPNVFVCIPVRRMPLGAPPSTIQYASTATILSSRDPLIKQLSDAGKINAITSHHELEMPGGCFVRVEVPRTYLTYGLGMSLKVLARDPLNAGGRFDLPQPPTPDGHIVPTFTAFAG